MLKSKYITADEFKEYFGIDLAEELNDTSNESNKVNAFLTRIEDMIYLFVNVQRHRDVNREYPNFTDHQKLCYKKALLEQAMYVFKNGDINTDSGYDPEEGVKANTKYLENISVAPLAKQWLEACGLLTRHVKGRQGAFFNDLWARY